MPSIKLDKLQTEKERASRLSLLQIESTTRCNLDCVYCAGKRLIKSGEIEVGDIETEQVMAALEKVKGKVETVLYQGWGEPMLCRDLPKLLEAAHKIGAKTAIVTNGTIFRKEVFDKCDYVSVSIDSLRQDYSARRRSNPVKVKENILKLRKNYPDLSIRLSTVVSKENINDLEKIIGFAREISAQVEFLKQIGEALLPIDKDDIQKIESLVSTYPDIVIWAAKPEERFLFNKEHSELKNSLFIDIHGQVKMSCYQDVPLGEIRELDKIIDQRIKRSSQLNPNGHL